ncbi:MAG: transcription antitermination factor NusB [Legionellaceae bacterium]|nr:transcription antitermination factor NusB [Legionellaceae bacterium]
MGQGLLVTVDKQIIKGRRRARKLAVQAIYQQLISKASSAEIEAQFRAIHGNDKVDFDYFNRLFYGVEHSKARLDEALLPFLDRPIDGLNLVELSVLRLGAFELTEVLEVPYRVILDESINLAKTFGAQDGYRYVNGVLNQLAQVVRKAEMN